MPTITNESVLAQLALLEIQVTRLKAETSKERMSTNTGYRDSLRAQFNSQLAGLKIQVDAKIKSQERSRMYTIAIESLWARLTRSKKILRFRRWAWLTAFVFTVISLVIIKSLSQDALFNVIIVLFVVLGLVDFSSVLYVMYLKDFIDWNVCHSWRGFFDIVHGTFTVSIFVLLGVATNLYIKMNPSLLYQIYDIWGVLTVFSLFLVIWMTIVSIKKRKKTYEELEQIYDVEININDGQKINDEI
eukprot:UN01871